MKDDDSPVLKVSLRLKDENWRKNSLTSLDPNPVFNEMWFLTVDPLLRISVFIAKLPSDKNCWRVLEDFHGQENIQFFDIHCGLFTPLAVMTVVGLHDFVTVSISASFKSFLLIICIDAPESTTNSRSSGL